jgi:uncharacterized protein with ATP-grasp and redox domains
VARQTLRVARLASDDVNVQRRILDEVIATIPGMDLEESPAVLSLVCYEVASKLSGKADPYLELKREQNAVALELEPELRERLRASEDPLKLALHLAAAGNIIDLGTMQAQHIDIRGTIAEVLSERFAIDDSARLRESLKGCRDLLFFLDNAGEIVFDKLLIEELQKYTKVTAVVKSAPILNDALIQDAEDVGLSQVCEVVENGGGFVGSPLGLISPGLLDWMGRADVIVGKGQGNYETIDDHPGNIFLILRAKCEVIAQHMGVKLGQVALISTRARREREETANRA